MENYRLQCLRDTRRKEDVQFKAKMRKLILIENALKVIEFPDDLTIYVDADMFMLWYPNYDESQKEVDKIKQFNSLVELVSISLGVTFKRSFSDLNKELKASVRYQISDFEINIYISQGGLDNCEMIEKKEVKEVVTYELSELCLKAAGISKEPQ